MANDYGTSLSLYLSEEEKKRIFELAKNMNLTPSKLSRMILNERLEQLEETRWRKHPMN